MSKTLEERLNSAKEALGKVDGALTRHAGRLPPDAEDQFRAIAAFGSHIDHWAQMFTARETARALLNDLERHADPFGPHCVLALGAVPIPARVVGDALMPARVTLLHVTA